MDSGLFLVASVHVDDVDTDAGWLTDDDDVRYRKINPIDIDEVRDRVYEMYRGTYAGFSAQPLIPSSHGLMKYARWILFSKVQVPAGEGVTITADDISAFALFKVTNPGLKAGLKGHDDSPEARRAIVRFAVRSFNADGIFGEVSPPIEDRIRRDVPVVPFEVAREVLEQLGKFDTKADGDEHYTRRIGNLGVVRKLMVGRPGPK